MNFGSKFKGTPIRSYFADPIHTFIDQCISIGITKGYYPFIKVQALKNLTKAVNIHLEKRGVPYYARMKYVEQSDKMLIELFDHKLAPLEERYTENDILAAKEFFRINEKDLSSLLEPGRQKDNIPEDHDIQLIICCLNMGWRYPYLISDDTHFTGYQEEIHKEYNIYVLEMMELRQTMKEWNWIH